MAKKGANNPAATDKPVAIDVHKFVTEMAARQSSLLEAMAAQIKSGEISVKDDARTERYIEAVVSDWCEQDEPTLEAHMIMCATVFYWALLDEVYIDELEANDNGGPRYATDKHAAVREITLEALKTIRAIWGNKHG